MYDQEFFLMWPFHDWCQLKVNFWKDELGAQKWLASWKDILIWTIWGIYLSVVLDGKSWDKIVFISISETLVKVTFQKLCRQHSFWRWRIHVEVVMKILWLKSSWRHQRVLSSVWHIINQIWHLQTV